MWQERNGTDDKMREQIGEKKLKNEKVRGEEEDTFKTAGVSQTLKRAAIVQKETQVDTILGLKFV